MNVLVTGADGFIGSHLAEALVRKGYKIRALNYYNSMGHEGWLDHIDSSIRAEIEVVSGDIRDAAFVRHAMTGVDGVFHLAALIGIPYSYINPESYVDTNIKGTLNVLQAARELGTRKIIHTSTSEVYGSARFVPITEEHPLQGQSPYSATKIAADHMAYAYYCSFNLPVITIRPFNTFGPRQSMRAVIPTVIGQLLKGDAVQVGSITPTRDFSHVEDTVSGFITAFESSNEQLLGQTINLGSGFEISVEEMIHEAAALLNRQVKINVTTERKRPEKSEVERLYCDNSKAKALMNWAPHYAGKEGFKKALQNTIEWYASPVNIARFKTEGYSV